MAAPAQARPAFLAAACLGFAAFSVYGVPASLAPTFLTTALGEHSPAAAGAVVFTAFAAGAAIQALLLNARTGAASATGQALLAPGLACVATALWVPALPLFLTGAALAGAGSGALLRQALTGATAPEHARAEVLADFFVATYLGVSLPSLALGAALGAAPARTVAPCFAATAVLAAAAGRRLRAAHRRTGAPPT